MASTISTLSEETTISQDCQPRTTAMLSACTCSKMNEPTLPKDGSWPDRAQATTLSHSTTEPSAAEKLSQLPSNAGLTTST